MVIRTKKKAVIDEGLERVGDRARGRLNQTNDDLLSKKEELKAAQDKGDTEKISSLKTEIESLKERKNSEYRDMIFARGAAGHAVMIDD